jgi:hypothetical protein
MCVARVEFGYGDWGAAVGLETQDSYHSRSGERLQYAKNYRGGQMMMRTVQALRWLLLAAPSLNSMAADQNPFQKAVSFALTGVDDAPVITESQADCVFRVEGRITSGDDETKSIEVYHLNNVDPGRIVIQQMVQTVGPIRNEYIEIRLYGEDTVYEDRAIYHWNNPQRTVGPEKSSQQTLGIYTKEYDRMVRAWKYIYSHGCRGAKSSF